MTINHRAQAERHLSQASFWTGDGPHDMPVNPAATDAHLRMAQVHATLAAADEDPIRATLATLLERWEEDAEQSKPSPDDPDDYITERYRNYRLMALRNIRELRHVLNTSRIPCALMTPEERRDCECSTQQ